MASLTLSLFAAITLLVVTSWTIQPSSAIPPEILLTICSTLENQQACESVLNNNPRTNKADLIPQLSLISIEIVSKHGLDNLKTFSNLLNNATNDWSKAHFDMCVSLYQVLQSEIQEAHRMSLDKDYGSISPWLVQAKRLAFDCPVRNMLATCEASISVNSYIRTCRNS